MREPADRRTTSTRDTGQRPLPAARAWAAVARCIVRSALLLVRGRLHQPRRHVGLRVHFADGTTSRVYRETAVDRAPTRDPAVLVVGFRLRGVRGWGHRLFRAESELNTPLFVGFPGFVSKLWCAHDDNGFYRGLYEWDGAGLAEDYARALWRVLALVSEGSSIRYHVVPGLRRDEMLTDPARVGAEGSDAEWWRPVAVEPALR